MANYSPPSSGNHRSLFVKPAKRGKQRAGGEALFPFLRFAKGLGVRLKGAVLEALFPTFFLNNYCISFHSYMVSLPRKEAFGNLLCKEYISDCWLTELT